MCYNLYKIGEESGGESGEESGGESGREWAGRDWGRVGDTIQNGQSKG